MDSSLPGFEPQWYQTWYSALKPQRKCGSFKKLVERESEWEQLYQRKNRANANETRETYIRKKKIK